jgi:hypothetical protein
VRSPLAITEDALFECPRSGPIMTPCSGVHNKLMPTESAVPDADLLARELQTYIQEFVTKAGSSKAIKPDHRVKFSWPPHPISYSYHVLASDWTGSTSFASHGEEFPVMVAKTPHGVFGKSAPIWLESRGDTLESMLKKMAADAEPLLKRQFVIAECLGRDGRFKGTVRELAAIDLLKLLYCKDRDVANDAQREIETHARSGLFTPALIAVLNDRQHPNRRSAQWCVLDMFEDLPSFASKEPDEVAAIAAMKGLIWDADDDYARTAFKAGVVLGGHVPSSHGGPVLLQCLDTPSKIGRRSAIHGLYHVVEWLPEMRDQVVAALRSQSAKDPEPLLRSYAKAMAEDIEQDNAEHFQEPMFPDEN